MKDFKDKSKPISKGHSLSLQMKNILQITVFKTLLPFS
jgi:hypothetical protein